MLSQERVQDSSGDESSSPEPTQTFQERVNSISQKPSDSRPDLGQSLNSENTSSDAESEISPTKPTSSSSSSGSRSKRKSRDRRKDAMEPPTKRSKPNYANVKRIESTTYAPPSGYSAVQLNTASLASEASTAFDDLDGKQIWHISAPSTISISELESLDVSAGLKGKTMLQHKGVHYTMTSTDVEGAKLLLPKGRSGEYAVAEPTISQAFHIQESLEKSTNGQSNQVRGLDKDAASQNMVFFATQVGQMGPPRKQPQNLKVRYTPYGVSMDKQIQATNTDSPADINMTDDGVVESESRKDLMRDTPRSAKKSKSRKTAEAMNMEGTPMRGTKSSQVSSPIESSPTKEKKKRKEKTKKDNA